MITTTKSTEERRAIDAAVEGITLVDVLRRNAREHADRPAIHWHQDDRWEHLTWAAYRQRVAEVAAGLISLGLAPGDVVAIQATNRPEHAIADMAAIHAGGPGVTFYGTLAAGQIGYIGRDCRAKVAVLEDPSCLDRWRSVRGDLPDLQWVVLMEGADQGEDRVLSWESLITRGREALTVRPDLVEERCGALKPSDVATLIYTSGTTGFPKGVVFTHRNVLWTTESVRRAFDLPANLRVVSYLPLAHIAERMSTHYLGTWLACEVYYCPDPGQVLEYVIRARPQAFLGVPRVWEKFQSRLSNRFEKDARRSLILAAVKNAEALVRARQQGRPAPFRSLLNRLFDRLVFTKVRQGLGMDEVTVAITTAAPTSPDLILFFNALGIPLCELYGLSECSGPATSNRPGSNRIGTAGWPLPGVEVTIEADGEVLVRGGNVVDRYHNLPDETASTFDNEGWLHTGDLGRIDEDGYLTIVGRKKDLIITAAGKNIAPAQTETRLKNHALVAHACVVGDGRPFLTALIALDREEAPIWAGAHGIEFTDLEAFSALGEVRAEIQKTIDEVNRLVSRVEQIKKFAIVPHDWSPDTGEITPSLKVRRAEVMAMYQDLIEEMYRQ
jgi:long-chain acyl-CoA synthetase